MVWTIPTQDIRKLSRHTVLDLIRFSPGGISRIELSRRMGLTRAAVGTIVNDLLNARLVREADSRLGSRGRRPVVLEINPDNGYVLGVDMGATHVSILLADYSGRVVNEIEAPLDVRRGAGFCLGEVDRLVRNFIFASGHKLEEIHAAGVGVPGPVVSEAGIVSGPPIMPGWDGYPIRNHLAGLWGIPVILGNDAEMGAFGEWAYGAGRGEQNLVYIKVGTGVGAGLLIDGQIYRGSTGCAGEIGHVTLNENGPLCTCGNRGCLEAFIGGRAIANQAIQAVQHGQRTILSQIKPLESISSRDIITAARNGDLIAQEIVTIAGGHLGTALAGLVNLFNPGMVVIGGSVAQIGDLFLEPTRQAVRERSLGVSSRSVRITTALLGRRSSGMGAVVQALTIALHQRSEKKEVKPNIQASNRIKIVPVSS